jgi:hypothetical protein
LSVLLSRLGPHQRIIAKPVPTAIPLKTNDLAFVGDATSTKIVGLATATLSHSGEGMPQKETASPSDKGLAVFL